MARKDVQVDKNLDPVPDETTMPGPVERVDQKPEEQIQTRGIVHPPVEPGFFERRNSPVHIPRTGKDRRINTVERRAEDRRNMK